MEKRYPRWVNMKNPVYVKYYEEEWGFLQKDEGMLFEMLLLETFVAGLSFECVLMKREGFREAFDGFDPRKIACYDGEKLQSLQENSAIIRHGGKIRAAVATARAFLAVQEEYGSFFAYLQSFSGGKVIHEIGRTSSPLSLALSRDLQKRGVRYFGSVTAYAYLQAVGMISSREDDFFG